MSTKMSFAPSRANARAMPRPMPRAPPVMNAVFPSMRSMTHLQDVPIGATAQKSTPCCRSLLVPQLVEQSLGVLQVGGVKALGEPVVDIAEHCARLVTAPSVAQQACEAGGRAQLKRFRALTACDFD